MRREGDRLRREPDREGLLHLRRTWWLIFSGWFASTVHVPEAMSDTDDPDTVHTPALVTVAERHCKT